MIWNILIDKMIMLKMCIMNIKSVSDCLLRSRYLVIYYLKIILFIIEVGLKNM